MTNNKKKLILLLAVGTLATLLLIGATLAFLTDSKGVLNIVGIGRDNSGKNTVAITLTEPKFVQQIQDRIRSDGESAGALTYDADTDELTKAEMYNIIPNQKISKDPTITNTGAEAVYLRMKVLQSKDGGKSWSDAFQNTLLTGDPSTGVGLGLTLGADWFLAADGYYYYSVGGASTGTGSTLAVSASVDIFQYDTAVPADKISMKIPEKWDYADIESVLGLDSSGHYNTLNLDVKAEAIQSRDFTPNLAAANPWTYSDTTPVVVP